MSESQPETGTAPRESQPAVRLRFPDYNTPAGRRVLVLVAELAAVLGAALATRLPGFNSGPLWLDELWRANFVLSPDWPSRLFDKSGYSAITTFGYAALNSGLNAAGPSPL